MSYSPFSCPLIPYIREELCTNPRVYIIVRFAGRGRHESAPKLTEVICRESLFLPALARALAVFLCGALLASFGGVLLAQSPPPPPPPGQPLSPDQLDDLVAPIALYPDPLISQILVAATYPLEVVQASQWMQRNPGLNGPALTQAAEQQNWDPSIQALVVFPDVMKRLTEDVTWTTNLGNAFLAQQADVMDAVQRMRQKAQDAGKLASTTQQRVVQTTDAGRPVIEIVPADPQVIYVPVYDPAWIWGPPLWYPYPRWVWGPRPVFAPGIFFGFGGGIQIGAFFGGGWGGWGGWGWHPGWGSRTVVVNNTFITRNNFNTTHITNVHGTTVWNHDSLHRQGVPYANSRVAEQYHAPVRQNLRTPEIHNSPPARAAAADEPDGEPADRSQQLKPLARSAGWKTARPRAPIPITDIPAWVRAARSADGPAAVRTRASSARKSRRRPTP